MNAVSCQEPHKHCCSYSVRQFVCNDDYERYWKALGTDKITPILNNYFGDGVTSQNIFFKIISDFNIVGDGVPISQNNLIKFYLILLF